MAKLRQIRSESSRRASPRYFYLRSSLVAVTVGMTVQQIAPQLDVTGRSLARELGLPLDTPKNTPVKTLGVTEEQLGHVVHHLLGRRESTLKY